MLKAFSLYKKPAVIWGLCELQRFCTNFCRNLRKKFRHNTRICSQHRLNRFARVIQVSNKLYFWWTTFSGDKTILENFLPQKWQLLIKRVYINFVYGSHATKGWKTKERIREIVFMWEELFWKHIGNGSSLWNDRIHIFTVRWRLASSTSKALYFFNFLFKVKVSNLNRRSFKKASWL